MRSLPCGKAHKFSALTTNDYRLDRNRGSRHSEAFRPGYGAPKNGAVSRTWFHSSAGRSHMKRTLAVAALFVCLWPLSVRADTQSPEPGTFMPGSGRAILSPALQLPVALKPPVACSPETRGTIVSTAVYTSAFVTAKAGSLSTQIPFVHGLPLFDEKGCLPHCACFWLRVISRQCPVRRCGLLHGRDALSDR